MTNWMTNWMTIKWQLINWLLTDCLLTLLTDCWLTADWLLTDCWLPAWRFEPESLSAVEKLVLERQTDRTKWLLELLSEPTRPEGSFKSLFILSKGHILIAASIYLNFRSTGQCFRQNEINFGQIMQIMVELKKRRYRLRHKTSRFFHLFRS